MSFYNKLTADQVNAVHNLINFLERLRIIGHLSTTTYQTYEALNIIGEMEPAPWGDTNYGLVKNNYNPDKTKILEQELLERIFGKLDKRYPKY